MDGQHMFQGKIFFIGFPKTGTTSVKKALRQLKLRVCGLVPAEPPLTREHLLERASALVPQYDAFQNCPWAMLYRELDERFPGSKFVLTYREDQRWIDSVARHFGGESTAMRTLVFGHGDPLGNEAIYLSRYREHNDAVREYFRDRPQDFLEFGLTQGEGWERLCPFIEAPIPAKPFPHANRRVVQRFFEKLLGGGRETRPAARRDVA
ncbi:MAG: hypothetical protein KDB14_07095 [Planctomycetales bacterium]|nr:hypothetical protein [Planctomycetales bacterium]